MEFSPTPAGTLLRAASSETVSAFDAYHFFRTEGRGPAAKRLGAAVEVDGEAAGKPGERASFTRASGRLKICSGRSA